MTSPPADGPSPVRIDVPTEKVDATLDLVERLASISDLANRLAAELAAVQGEAPEIQQALEADSAERNQ